LISSCLLFLVINMALDFDSLNSVCVCVFLFLVINMALDFDSLNSRARACVCVRARARVCVCERERERDLMKPSFIFWSSAHHYRY